MSELDDYPTLEDLWGEGPYYSEECRNKILSALPCALSEETTVQLFAGLEVCAEFFVYQDRLNACPSGKEAYKIFDAIEVACEKVLFALKMNSFSSDSMPAFIHGTLERQARLSVRYGDCPSEAGNVPTTVDGLVRLLKWARLAKYESSAGADNKRDYPLEDLFRSLKEMWVETLNQRVGTSTSSTHGEAGGPMVRFFLACLLPLGVELTSESVRDRIRRQFMGK